MGSTLLSLLSFFLNLSILLGVLNFHKWGETAQGLRPLVAMLEDQDHLLLCWRTTIWFPAAISGSFQSPITLFPGESDTPFWALLESVHK